jgi:hypothetical protein
MTKPIRKLMVALASLAVSASLAVLVLRFTSYVEGGGLLAPDAFVLDPRTDVSPSGEYALHVDPSEREGRGPANYRFTRAGRELWSGTRPWTLQETVVTDDGLVAGYAYAAGGGGGPGDALTIVVLAPDGTARLEDRHALGVEGCMAAPPRRPLPRPLERAPGCAHAPTGGRGPWWTTRSSAALGGKSRCTK